ncbi:uncharacterized protein LOC134546893 isoform X5 [Prinia subflava]|uniref:uncharacterized protein LOC134546893 isoform X5 n=1 Tax=Prinia subflava TaxID=208062 RepID=UPI002FE0E37C
MPYQPCSREAADESGQGGSAALCVREGTSGTSREKRARAEGRLRDERTSLQSSRGHSTALAFQLGQGRNVGWFPQHLPASETSPLPAPRWLRGECGHFEKKYSINSSGLSIFKKNYIPCESGSSLWLYRATMYSILVLPWSISYGISALSLRSTKPVDM